MGEFLNGGAVGPDSSSVKLLMAEAEQRSRRPRSSFWGRHRAGRPSRADEDAFWDGDLPLLPRRLVYGGTQQIQRNIIADRILALPQE